MDEQINWPNADDPRVTANPAPQTGAGHNAPEISVSDLSNMLKRMVEQNFSHVRVRGELSKVTIAKSGHIYTGLKDADAVLDAVCWRGTAQRLSIRPEEGLEVICTGRLTTYPGRSNYQMVIESMELAGQGAILKMLADRKAKLAAEGLFDPARKKPLPYLPRRIGIVTSPTGAVIRDILHRISDRFPVPVYLWPVMVQGAGAAQQVAAAINGFNALPDGFDKPDVLIVARGGGSFEDLMPFNEEIVVRAVANSKIPVISAVGHETDVTLCDFAADLRAPTPTGAAEMVVPVRRDLLFTLSEHGLRLGRGLSVQTQRRRERTREMAAGLARFPRSLEIRGQRLDYAGGGLVAAFPAYLRMKETRLARTGARLLSPAAMLHKARARLQAAQIDNAMRGIVADRTRRAERLGDRLAKPDILLRQKGKELEKTYENFIRRKDYLFAPHEKLLHSYGRILETLSFKNVLKRGYSVVEDEDGKIVASASAAREKDHLVIRFADGKTPVKPA